MDLLLRGGRILDPSARRDASADLLIRNGRIAAIGGGLAVPSGGRVVDVAGLLVCPGLVDLHVHLREPGQEYKEDIETGSRAAAAGGFTTVCCMPNTRPPNDCAAITELIVRRARDVGLCRVRPVGAITRGLAGQELADIADMRHAGAVAISDDGRPVMNAGVMRRALEYARTFDLPVVQHAEDLCLSEGGAMNEGETATRLGLRGQPSNAESVMVARDLELCEWTGARYHVAHASVARTFELVRAARQRGLPVSCEVAPHHFALTEEDCAGYDTSTKVAPPLRTSADREAARCALAEGTADCIASDHAPHSALEKDIDYHAAAFGMIGLETTLGLTLELWREQVITLARAIELLSSGPARVFGLDREGVGSLREGEPADVCVIDLGKRWRVDRERLKSRSQNTPFHGRELVGAAILTLLAGRPVYDAEDRLR
jgi:dihydroorotase